MNRNPSQGFRHGAVRKSPLNCDLRRGGSRQNSALRRGMGMPMTHSRFWLILVAAGIGALIWIWPGPARAQASACYNACRIPATSVSAPRYVACLGIRIGNNCTVCPGQLTGQSLQIIANKTVSCLKACAKGYVWNAASRQCCPGQTPNSSATADADLHRGQ